MFVRKKKNKSGSISVQIIDKSSGKYKVVQSVGASSNLDEVEKLYFKALELIPSLQKQPTFHFLSQSDEQILGFIKNLNNTNITAVGGELIFGALFDKIGFNMIEDKIFRDLVLSRIIYQGSKLKLVEYIRRYEHREISVHTIYRFLDKLNKKYKIQVEEIAFKHTQKILGQISVVFYDRNKGNL